jgi:hypothetical protein
MHCFGFGVCSSSSPRPTLPRCIHICSRLKWSSVIIKIRLAIWLATTFQSHAIAGHRRLMYCLLRDYGISKATKRLICDSLNTHYNSILQHSYEFALNDNLFITILLLYSSHYHILTFRLNNIYLKKICTIEVKYAHDLISVKTMRFHDLFVNSIKKKLICL